MGFVLAPATLFIATPAWAINNANYLVSDPARYFPGCTCQATFLSFVVWMIALLIIAMFQYGEHRKKRLTAYWFSIIAIILAFIIYSVPLATITYLLKSSNFPVNQETGKYEYSLYGEKEDLSGNYTQAEVDTHVVESRTGVIASWIILGVVCLGAGLSIPAYLKHKALQAKKAPPPRRGKRKSKGRVGTRVVKEKEKEKGKEKDKKGGDDKKGRK
jgi:hypothetical protein